MILLRAVHWFNPAVWLAFRRLRADQELACDAAVMSRLDVPERRHYGATLIKLLEDFSARGLCPGVVPFVTNKQVIKRRISMIAAFKPTGRLAMLGSFAIVGLLGISTFTRASQGTMGASPVEGEPVAAPSYGATLNPFGASAEALNRVVKDMDDRVRNQELMVAKLRAAFQVVDSDPQSSGPGSSLGPMNILQLNSIKIQAESDAMKQEAQLETLEALAKADPEQLKHTLPRLTSDPILTQLLQESLTVESQLAFQLGTMGKEHPDVKKNIELKKKLDEQIGKQVAANLEAMKTGVRTSKAQAENAQRRLDEARANDIKIAVETRPYWEAKAELDRMKRMQEVIQLRKVQEQIEAGLGTLGHQSSPTLLKDDSLAESIRALIDKLNQMNATQKAGAGQESRQPSSGVSPEVRRKYAEARELLSQARDGYKQELLSVPDGSPLLDRHKRRIAQFEAEVAKYDAQYPGIAVAGNPEVLSWSSALVLIVERDGTMKFGSSKEAISLDQLKTALMREHEKDPTIVLNIKADTSVPAQRIYDILDAAKKAGISSISLQTLSNLK
jgi:biopolymer transport protein ExbD